MKRRSFVKGTTTALAGLGLPASSYAHTHHQKTKEPVKLCVTLDQEKVFFFAEVIKESIKVVHIADTHLFKDDDRGIPYQVYSNRMAKAYNQTTHFKTQAQTHPEEAFEQALEFAKDVQADVMTLVGDIFSFPSEAAIEWVLTKLEDTGIPYIYTAGNHDWHYEGMEGPLNLCVIHGLRNVYYHYTKGTTR